jgi:hypothetical protein
MALSSFPSLRSTALPGLFLLLSSTAARGQDKALACLFSEDFSAGGTPAGWDIGAQVLRLDGSGELVDAWRTGTASEANTNGFFPVPNEPVGNRFFMANDDAAPCDCAMEDVTLTTPVLDLSIGADHVLECRVFNDQRFGSSEAIIEGTTDGTTWNLLLTIPAVEGEWQRLFVDLSALSGSTSAQLRFRWNDGGVWASGIAVDDVCVRQRLAQDLSIVTVYPHDPAPSPFNAAERTLRYTEIPLEQVEALTVSADVRNSGTGTLRNVIVSTTILHDGQEFGPFTSAVVDSLMPGEEVLVRIPTDWTPTALGAVDLNMLGTADGPDDDTNDNSGMSVIHITGAGWENRYGAMAMLAGPAEGLLGGEEEFVACSRMELVSLPIAPAGISALLGNGTTVGAQVRGILFDANLAFVDTTERHTITEEDLTNIGAGIPLYLPLANGVTLSGDHFAGIQFLGQGGSLYIATSGNNAPGASLLMLGSIFEVEYPRESPMVRLHYSAYGVGIDGPDRAASLLRVFPSPASDRLYFSLPADAGTDFMVRVLDATGREWSRTHSSLVRSSGREGELNTEVLPNGSYLLVIGTHGSHWSGRFTIVH